MPRFKVVNGIFDGLGFGLGLSSLAFVPPDVAKLFGAAEQLRGFLAVRALGKLGTKALPHLMVLLEDKDLRTDVIRAIGKIGLTAEAATPTIARFLKEGGQYDTKPAAAEALANLGTKGLTYLLAA